VVSGLTKPTVWFGVDPSDPMDPYGSLWIPMDPYGSLWIPMDPYGFWGVLAFGGELVELVVVFCSQP